MWRSILAFCFTVLVALLGSLEQAQAQPKPEIKPPASQGLRLPVRPLPTSISRLTRA